MNKKIKSGKEIEKEINLFFENSNDSKELATNIKNYIDKVTGKELKSKNEIEKMVYNKLINTVFSSNCKFKINNDLIQLYPFLKFIKRNIKLIREANDETVSLKYENIKMPSSYRFCIKLMKMSKGIDLNDNALTYDDLESIFQTDYKVLELFLFLEDNRIISDLLLKYDSYEKKEFLTDLIVRKITPLNSIFIYFDRNKDVKENTESLYLLMNKRIPRNSIQQAIKRDIENLKKGKFLVLNM